MLFSKFVFQAELGRPSWNYICTILLTQVFLAISFGLGIGYIAKTAEASRAIIMVVIATSLFLWSYFVSTKKFRYEFIAH
ncbi:hypothetical protein ACT7DA_18005 [Bacillus pacificus]